MRPIVPVIVLVLSVIGCASYDDIGETEALGLDGWIGATDRELVLSWGAPDAMYELTDGSRVLTWRSTHTEIPGEDATARPGVKDRQPASARPKRYECVTNIEVGPTGKIRDYAIQGNGCPQQPE